MSRRLLRKQFITQITIFISLFSLLSACGLSKTVKEEALTPSQNLPTGEIVFNSFLDGDSEVYVLFLPAGSMVKLTENSAFDGYASWSPDGRQIAFLSDRDGDQEIYVMNADGSGQTRLTYSVGEDAYPSWSPDGRYIAFSSMQDGNFHIWVMNSDGGNQHPLTKDNNVHLYPAWLKNDQIMFTTIGVGTQEIFLMNSDGSGVTLVEYLPGQATVSWDLDNQRIAFAFKQQQEEDAEIYVVPVEGDERLALTNNDFNDTLPAWSPDGQWIVFQSNRDGNAEIYLMRTDGSNPVRLTNNSVIDTNPVWSP